MGSRATFASLPNSVRLVLLVLIGVGIVGLAYTFPDSLQLTGTTASTPDVDTSCEDSPDGAIGAVYNAYGGPDLSNPLGLPASSEKSLWTNTGSGVSAGQLINCGREIDKYQEFEHGSIYYNSQELTAFALFNQIDDYYQEHRGTNEENSLLGMPISSEINPEDDPNGIPCLGVFEKVRLLCNVHDSSVQLEAWSTNLAPMAEQIYLPELLLPVEGTGTYNGGPHAWGSGILSDSEAVFSSGLDIGGAGGETVIAMASGTVVDMHPEPNQSFDCVEQTYPNSGLGCWVAIRNDFSGTVIVYGHIDPHDDVDIGHWIRRGMPIGVMQPSRDEPIGNSHGPHVHIELRSGTWPCESGSYCLDGQYGSHLGEPVSWNGVIVDGYLISGAYKAPSSPPYLWDYDGTAVRVDSLNLSSHEIHSMQDLDANTDVQQLIAFENYYFKDIYETEQHDRDASSWMTIAAWNQCNTDYNKWCENGVSYHDTTFAWGGLDSSSTTPERLLLSAIEPELTSSNQYVPYEPRYLPPYDNPPTPEPTPTTIVDNCPTDGRNGVYFYRDQDYRPPCVYSVDDIPDFTYTDIGDNALSSIRIIGEWEVQLFEDDHYGGRHDVLYSNDADLDIRSLGDQYSSAKITDDRETCPTDGREGVYMYSNRNYGGHCLFATEDVGYFGDTVIGDNDLSSIRFIGTWETKIWEDSYYRGRYDVVGSDDPDLDVRSLGSQYSSINIESIVVDPTATPTPTPTPAPTAITLLSPSVRNGGFESGNLNNWQQEGGSFVVATESPHSGTYYVRGTSATEAKCYQRLGLDGYRSEIAAGRGSAYFSVWVDIGKSEQYYYRVYFVDSTGNELWQYNTGWSYHPGGYEQRSGNVSQIPGSAVAAYVEVGAKRTNGDFTDADFDDFNFTLQIGSPPAPPTATPTATPTAMPIPDCSTYTSDRVTLFDYAFCNPSAGTLNFGITKALYNLSVVNWDNRIGSLYIPTGWSVLAFEGVQATGARRCLNESMWDLNIDLFSREATGMNNTISSIVVYEEPNCPALEASPLVYNPRPLAGEQVEATFEITNVSGRPLSLSRLLVGVHGPYCDDWSCPNVVDFPHAEGIVLAPSESYRYEAVRAFNIPDDRYLIKAFTVEEGNWWYGHGSSASFAVAPGLVVESPLNLTPAEPLRGDWITATFSIRNQGSRAITVAQLGIVARGPNCASWECEGGWNDFPPITDLTIAPGASYNYREQRQIWEAGEKYFADVAFADENNWWYEMPGNARVWFSVEPDLELLAPPILTENNPATSELVTATLRIRNISERTLYLEGVLLGVHGPHCDQWDCPNVVDYPWHRDIVLKPNEVYTYQASRAFNIADDGYLMQAHTLDKSGVWRSLGSSTAFEVVPGIIVTDILNLAPAYPKTGDQVTARYMLQNVSDRPIYIHRFGVISHGPNCSDWSCRSGTIEFPQSGTLELQPGQSYDYQGSTGLTRTGSGFLADAAFMDLNEWWYTFAENERLFFDVQMPGSIYLPLVIR